MEHILYLVPIKHATRKRQQQTNMTHDVPQSCKNAEVGDETAELRYDRQLVRITFVK
jgi:hypothetical protein